MKEIQLVRLPWGKYDGKDIHYEYAVGFSYGDLGACNQIVEHSPVHVEIIFENAFIAYNNGLITKGKIYEA